MEDLGALLPPRTGHTEGPLTEANRGGLSWAPVGTPRGAHRELLTGAHPGLRVPSQQPGSARGATPWPRVPLPEDQTAHLHAENGQLEFSLNNLSARVLFTCPRQAGEHAGPELAVRKLSCCHAMPPGPEMCDPTNVSCCLPFGIPLVGLPFGLPLH